MLDLKGIRKTFNPGSITEKKALQGIDLHLEDGDFVTVIGGNGAGKSTFIKRFMDLAVIPNIKDVHKQERARDELPQSASGRTIMTTEPKFIPNEAVTISLDNNIKTHNT